MLKVNLAEKLLVTLLSKLTNFVPDGGIWMNTQRPEWNDANNALAGNGLSMVTLCYLRRLIKNLMQLFGEVSETPGIAVEVEELLQAVMRIFLAGQEMLSGTFDDGERREMVDQLGQAGENYRNSIYRGGFSEKNNLSRGDLGRSVFFLNEISRGSREIVEEDENGNVHFNGSIRNATELRMKLNGVNGLKEEEKD